MESYKHVVQYYETDRMGITHHSNYVRWMEESRIDFLKQIGWPYEKLEELGIVSPVTAVDCKYKLTTTFADEVFIEVSVEEFRGAKLKLAYHMKNAEGMIVCEAHSEHGFLSREGKLLRLRNEYPEFYQTLTELVPQVQ